MLLLIVIILVLLFGGGFYGRRSGWGPRGFGGLVEFAEVTERIVRIPSRILDHKHCFSLDRFDPTCPQCM